MAGGFLNRGLVGICWARNRSRPALEYPPKTAIRCNAAALAGADALLDGATDYTTPAQISFHQNGFTDGSGTTGDSNNVTVSVANPPTTGAHTGDNSAVQVTISQTQPTYFLKALGIASMGESVTSVATALSGQGCVYALDPSASQAFLTNSGTFSSSCGLMVDSNTHRL